MAAKNEEKCLIELCRHQQYLKPQCYQSSTKKSRENTVNQSQVAAAPQSGHLRQCYISGSTDHLQKNCKTSRKESTVNPDTNKKSTGNKMICAASSDNTVIPSDDPLQYMESDEEKEDGAYQRSVRVQDRGSRNPTALVIIQGVQAEGADITTIGAELFKKIAAVAHLKKFTLKSPDKMPYYYDWKPFKLYGKLELDITFQSQTMLTPVYLKLDAQDSSFVRACLSPAWNSLISL